jgi:hypothetical protein
MQRRGYDSDWGGWRLEGLERVYPAYPGRGVYPIDIERFTSSAHMLDMILQVVGKTWATNDCVAGAGPRSRLSSAAAGDALQRWIEQDADCGADQEVREEQRAFYMRSYCQHGASFYRDIRPTTPDFQKLVTITNRVAISEALHVYDLD